MSDGFGDSSCDFRGRDTALAGEAGGEEIAGELKLAIDSIPPLV